MKALYLSSLLLACSTSAFASIQTWQWSGTLNLVSAPLTGQFSVGQTFAVTMSVDTNAELQFGGLRDNFWRSSGTFLSAVDATVTVNDWYAAGFSDSGLQITNTDESAGSGYDQLTITPTASLDDIVAPVVDTGTETFTVNSIELNIYSDLADMILGSGAAFPTPSGSA